MRKRVAIKIGRRTFGCGCPLPAHPARRGRTLWNAMKVLRRLGWDVEFQGASP